MLSDVRRIYVVQDRETGAFVDINMGFVSSLRHAARCESKELARESMSGALYDGLLTCPSGYEIHELLELNED